MVVVADDLLMRQQGARFVFVSGLAIASASASEATNTSVIEPIGHHWWLGAFNTHACQ